MAGLIDIFNEIAALKLEESKRKSCDSIGTLRGGNTGVYAPGERPSSCARKAMLRTWHGLAEPSSLAKDMIFANGLSSEWQLVQDLTEATKRLYPKAVAASQQEIGTKWTTSNGTPVTGSPDFGLVQDGKVLMLTELKNMNSIYKALGVLGETPGVDAIGQLAHYMWVHGKCLGYLIYSSYTQFHNLDACSWMSGKVTKARRFSHLIDWGERKVKGSTDAKEAYPKSLLGFRLGFELKWFPDDHIYIRFAGLLPHGDHPENMPREEWVPTIVSWPLIKNYFEMCASDPATTWPDRPKTYKVDGSEGSLDLCLPAYCRWRGICDKCGKKSSINAMAEMIRREGLHV